MTDAWKRWTCITVLLLLGALAGLVYYAHLWMSGFGAPRSFLYQEASGKAEAVRFGGKSARGRVPGGTDGFSRSDDTGHFFAAPGASGSVSKTEKVLTEQTDLSGYEQYVHYHIGFREAAGLATTRNDPQ